MTAAIGSRPLRPDELRRVWPALSRSGAFPTLERLEEHCETMPWSARIAENGDVCLVAPWRARTRILAIRTLVCHDARVSGWVAEIAGLGGRHGFSELLSPFLPEEWLRSYLEAGMKLAVRLVALRAAPKRVVRASAPPTVTIRGSLQGDVGGVLAVDTACFDELWRFGRAEIEQLRADDRLVVAGSGERIIGYTHCTVSRGGLTLGRLAVAPEWRRRGVGAALLADAAEHAERIGASEIALCTQEHNAASRALYVSSGFAELPGSYALARIGICEDGESLC